jgi:hypothetical protein
MDVTKPYKFIGFGAMDVTKPCKFIGFGAMHAEGRRCRGKLGGRSEVLRGSNHGSGDLQLEPRPEPEIIGLLGLSEPDRLPNPPKKVGGFAPNLFWDGFGSRSGPLDPPKYDFWLRPGPWLQIPRILDKTSVALFYFGQFAACA